MQVYALEHLANPQVEAGGILFMDCMSGVLELGFFPLKAKIRLQEEHLGFAYETVDETSKNLPEGGYGICSWRNDL